MTTISQTKGSSLGRSLEAMFFEEQRKHGNHQSLNLISQNQHVQLALHPSQEHDANSRTSDSESRMSDSAQP